MSTSAEFTTLRDDILLLLRARWREVPAIPCPEAIPADMLQRYRRLGGLDDTEPVAIVVPYTRGVVTVQLVAERGR